MCVWGLSQFISPTSRSTAGHTASSQCVKAVAVVDHIDLFASSSRLSPESTGRSCTLIHLRLSCLLMDLQPCWHGGCQLVTLTKGSLCAPNPAGSAKPSVASVLSKSFVVIHPKSFNPRSWWMDKWWSADIDRTLITIPHWTLNRVIWIWWGN